MSMVRCGRTLTGPWYRVRLPAVLATSCSAAHCTTFRGGRSGGGCAETARASPVCCPSVPPPPLAHERSGCKASGGAPRAPCCRSGSRRPAPAPVAPRRRCRRRGGRRGCRAHCLRWRPLARPMLRRAATGAPARLWATSRAAAKAAVGAEARVVGGWAHRVGSSHRLVSAAVPCGTPQLLRDTISHDRQIRALARPNGKRRSRPNLTWASSPVAPPPPPPAMVSRPRATPLGAMALH